MWRLGGQGNTKDRKGGWRGRWEAKSILLGVKRLRQRRTGGTCNASMWKSLRVLTESLWWWGVGGRSEREVTWGPKMGRWQRLSYRAVDPP